MHRRDRLLAGRPRARADRAGGVGLRVFARALPYLDGAAELGRAGYLPGGAVRNRRYYASKADFEAGLDEAFRALFFVPETSGGLLAAVPEGAAEDCL